MGSEMCIRDSPWGDENSPPVPTFSDDVIWSLWDDILAVKRILSSNISRVIPRHDWTSGTIYSVYDSNDPTLLNRPFYVFTSESRVYKCIWNNGGTQSTVQPTGTGISNIETVDGYIWKYMYTVSSSDAVQFVTPSWIPVVTDPAISAGAVDGSVDFIQLTDGGSGYTTAPTVSITGAGLSLIHI